MFKNYMFCYLDYSTPKERFLYDKADYDAMRKQLIDDGWLEEFIASANNKSVEQLWESLKSAHMKMRQKFVPVKKCSTALEGNRRLPYRPRHKKSYSRKTRNTPPVDSVATARES